MKSVMFALVAAAAAGCCSLSERGCPGTCYPECVSEGFVSLFDGHTTRGWEGDLAAFSGEMNPQIGTNAWMKMNLVSDGFALVCKPGGKDRANAVWTKRDFDNVVLRFAYRVEPGDEAVVGLRTPAGACPCKSGVAVRLTSERPNPKTTWSVVEIRAVGNRLTVMLNGFIVRDEELPAGTPAAGRICLVGGKSEARWMNLRAKRVPAGWKPNACPSVNRAPAGFTALFDGKSLAGWKGVTTEEGFDRPWVRRAATPEKRAEMQKKADAIMREHWFVRDNVLFFDGRKGGYSLATGKDYGDFEMYADWRITTITGDSGFYPRGVCQVQIWDAHNEWHIGSGGLYNNRVHECNAMEIADRVPGDWNRCYMKMVGDRLTVRLNGVTVVDDVPLENANAKRFPGPIPACEQLELQCHGDPLEFRNIYIREL